MEVNRIRQNWRVTRALHERYTSVTRAYRRGYGGADIIGLAMRLATR